MLKQVYQKLGEFKPWIGTSKEPIINTKIKVRRDVKK